MACRSSGLVTSAAMVAIVPPAALISAASSSSSACDRAAEAFRTVCRCHLRHGTTGLTPTSTVARMSDYEGFLKLCGELYGEVPGGARIVGSHFYGPYFARPARGCHPDQDFLTPSAENAEAFTKLAAKQDCEASAASKPMPLVVTVAPEIDNAEWLVRTYAPRR